MSGGVLLDTHALVWWVAEPQRLSPAARAAIEGADVIGVSAASAWEIALLVDAGRIRLDRPPSQWITDVLARPKARSLPLDAQLAVASVALGRRGFHRDPADRFLYATASRERLVLVSKDAAICEFATHDGGARVRW